MRNASYFKTAFGQAPRKLLGVVVMTLMFVPSPVHAAAKYHVVLAQNSFDPSAGVTMVAAAKGFFARRQLDVHVIDLTAGKLALQAVLGGAANFGTVAESPLMHAALAGQPAVIIAATDTSYSDVKLIARRGIGIKSIPDLNGKTVATAIGTNAEFFVSDLLHHYGLKRSDIHLINLDPQNMALALARKDIDAYAVWEPFVYRGRALLGNQAKVFNSGHIYLNYFTITALRGYVTQHPAIVHRFLLALIDAERYMKQHPRETTAIIGRKIGMGVQAFSHIRGDFHYHVALTAGLGQLLQQEARWAIRSGTAPASAKPGAARTIIVPGPLESVDAKRVSGY